MASKEDVPALLRGGVDSLIRALDFVVPAVLEEVEYEDGEPLGIVRELGADRDPLDKIPIWRGYAGDGYGHEPALHPPERGVMICLDYPLETTTQDTEPPKNTDLERGHHHVFEDGFFLPGVLLDGERGMDSPIEADWWDHESGSYRHISEDGDIEYGHHEGHTIELTADHVRATFERNDGETVTVTADEDGARIETPDEDGGTSKLVASSDGTGAVDAFASIGDADAKQVNPSQTGDTHSGYAETASENEPLADPSTTNRRNSTAAQAVGPLDMQGYEVRNSPLPRRDADPNPAVSDPTNPAFYPGDSIPIGYAWLNMDEETAKIWWFDDSPHEFTIS